MGAVATRGRLHLEPVGQSLDRTTLVVEIDLALSDGSLTFGDLRMAAEKFEAYGHHEVAHRIWLALAQAAEGGMVPKTLQRAARAIDSAGSEVSDRFQRSGVKFDYFKIAAERLDGHSASDVALMNGCSNSTVARAVDYVQERQALLERQPDFFSLLTPQANPELLASVYGVEGRIMRWIVASNFDRRR